MRQDAMVGGGGGGGGEGDVEEEKRGENVGVLIERKDNVLWECVEGVAGEDWDETGMRLG